MEAKKKTIKLTLGEREVVSMYSLVLQLSKTQGTI